jgi:hypothetical protein
MLRVRGQDDYKHSPTGRLVREKLFWINGVEGSGDGTISDTCCPRNFLEGVWLLQNIDRITDFWV